MEQVLFIITLPYPPSPFIYHHLPSSSIYHQQTLSSPPQKTIGTDQVTGVTSKLRGMQIRPRTMPWGRFRCTSWDWSFIPLSAGFYTSQIIPGGCLGFLNHPQYQFDQSNSSVQYIHFHSAEPSWYHWGGMRSCSSHIITSFLHFKLFDKHVLQNHRLFFPKPILPAKLCTEDNFPKQELPYKKHQKAPKDKSIHLCWASLERLRLLDAPVPQPTLHLLEFGKPSNNCPL